MRRPIKHILDDTVTDEAGAVVRAIHIVQGVTAADPYNAVQSQVNAGSAIVKRVHLMLEFAINESIAGTAGVMDRLDWYIWFNIAGAQAAPDPRTSGQFDTKNQIFHMGSALLGQRTAGSVGNDGSYKGFVVYDLIVNIPTWAQKINKDDTIDLIYVHSDSAANKWLKMKAIFMEIEQS